MDTWPGPHITWHQYDYHKISGKIDFFFIMDYNMSGKRKVGPNCPYNAVVGGKFGVGAGIHGLG